MKKNNGLKITLAIVLIILVSAISFVGIYIKDKNSMQNVLPEYQLGMDLKGARSIVLKVDTSTITENYDAEGKLIEEGDTQTEIVSSKELPANEESALTKENYEKTKKIIEQRLEAMHVSEYLIRFNPNTGDIYLQIPENNVTDLVSQYCVSRGVYQIIDADTKEVLMTDEDVKTSKVGYNSQTGEVLLSIEYTKEGKQKIRDISNTYVTSTDAEGKEVTKSIEMKIDGATILKTSFSEEITNGMMSLSIGNSSSNADAATAQQNLQQASNMAILLKSGAMPVKYEIVENRFIFSDITTQDLKVVFLVMSAIFVILLIFMIVKHKGYGILAALSCIGFLAILLVILRYTNVLITIEGIFGIAISVLLDYILMMVLLRNKDKDYDTKVKRTKENTKKFLNIAVPALIISVVFSFSSWLPIFSFGMVLFWGVVILTLYNLLIIPVFVLDYKTK